MKSMFGLFDSIIPQTAFAIFSLPMKEAAQPGITSICIGIASFALGPL